MSEPTFEIPGLIKELPDQSWPHSVSCAYWLGVRRAHARELDNRMRTAADDERAMWASLRDAIAAKAEQHRAELQAALAEERKP